MSETANGLVNRRYFNEVWNGPNVAVVDEVFADDYVIHQGGQTMPVTRQTLKDRITAIRRGFPDFRMQIEHVIGDDDMVAAFLINEGTHSGELMLADWGRSLPARGRSVTFTESVLFRFADGRVTEVWYVSDRLAMLRGLGVVS